MLHLSIMERMEREKGLDIMERMGREKGLGDGREVSLEESVLDALRLGLGPRLDAAGSALMPEAQVPDEVLLRRIREFIRGSSLEEGWRG